mmetsp:Transcript_105119/g.224535  ORF Transcript_105119/g.224535 Transcript_105119/m.224535 type:complete len:202 (+) Transcript_105119:349-954(+)
MVSDGALVVSTEAQGKVGTMGDTGLDEVLLLQLDRTPEHCAPLWVAGILQSPGIHHGLGRWRIANVDGHVGQAESLVTGDCAVRATSDAAVHSLEMASLQWFPQAKRCAPDGGPELAAGLDEQRLHGGKGTSGVDLLEGRLLSVVALTAAAEGDRVALVAGACAHVGHTRSSSMGRFALGLLALSLFQVLAELCPQTTAEP